jgi:hypothetical protein
MPPNTDISPVTILLESDEDKHKALCETYQKVIARILYQSQGASLLMRAGLMMQVYGGWVFKVSLEPNKRHLKYRTRVIGFAPSLIDPTYDLEEMWRLRECFVGYKIPAQTAIDLYGITPNKNKSEVVYLEHWTDYEFRIVVDNKIPAVPGYQFEGPNKIGRVPIAYVRHISGNDFWGMSHAERLINIEHEVNDRMTDRGDVADESSHQTLIGKNLRQTPKYEHIKDGPRAIRSFINIGAAQAVPNSPQPEMEYAKQSPIPEHIATLPEELLGFAMIMARVPEASTGKVIKGSGRTTGPVTVAEMWPAISHTTAERTDFSTALREMGDMVLRAVRAIQEDGVYGAAGLKLPKITDEFLDDVIFTTSWNAPVPLSAETENRMINEDVAAGTCSIERALILKRVRDVKGELKKIQDDMRFQAQIEAEAQMQIEQLKADTALEAEQLKADTAGETAKTQAETQAQARQDAAAAKSKTQSTGAK